jgi:hypothetical protein
MHQVRKLIAQIRAALGDSPPPLPLVSLATEYARWREEAARRLEVCAGMLARGSEHSALEQAEAAPPLLDLVAELTFAEEPQWQVLCSRHELPTGPLIDTRTVAALDDIYAKGISPNSPLYQDYRAAVTARDDAKALHIIRTIARVNPSDTNAQSELERLRNKFTHAKLESLRAALKNDDDNAATDLVDELEELSSAEKLQTHPEYPRGVAVRKRVRLARAARELPVLLEEMDRLKQAGDWHNAADRLALIDQQERELGLALDGTQAARRDAIRQFVDDRRADASEQNRFLQSVEKLKLAGEQAATRAAGASTLTLEEAQELEAKFDQIEHEVKQFRRTVPEPAASSINASRRAVHGAAGRIRRRIATRRFLKIAAIVLVVGSGIAWAGRSALVKSYREKLEGFQKDGQALAAQELLMRIQNRNMLGIHSDPELQAAVAETGRWVSGQDELRNQAQTQVTALEKEDPARAGTIELHDKLTAVNKLTEKLAPDMAMPLKERIATVQRRIDAHFAKLREASTAAWRTTFAEAQSMLASVGFETPASEAVKQLAKAAPVMQALEKEVHHPVPSLRPDGDQLKAYQDLSKKESELRTEANALDSARNALQEAGTLEAYATALKSYAAVRYSETLLAQPVLKDFPSSDDMPAHLLMDGDLDAWRAVELDKAFGAAMHPQDVRQEEVNVLLALRDDQDLKDVWQWTLHKEGGVHTAYSRGKLREFIVGGEKRFTGKVWEPKEKEVAPVYTEVRLPRYGGPISYSSFTLSSTSRLLDHLKLQEFTDSSGTKWERTAYEVIGDIVRAPVGSLTAKAIFLQHIAALTALRPYEWGRHYCPTLTRDLAELDALCGGRRLNTYEWMLPATTSKLEPKLEGFFGRLAGRNYLNDARRFRDVALAVREAGAIFAGYVDDDHNARILSEARSSPELWCLGEEGPILLRITPGAANSGLGAQTKSCRPFSPLFRIPLDRVDLVQRMRIQDDTIPFLKLQ